MLNINAIQAAIRKQGIDGWLFYDFRNRDYLALKILGLSPDRFATRRWYYYVPANGTPCKLVSVVEQSNLDQLPGEKLTYLSWREMHEQLRHLLGNSREVAMNYSPMNNIPYVSMVDAGTIEIIRHLGYEPVSAANLIQQFEALLTEDGYQTHVAAGDKILGIKDEAYSMIGDAVVNKRRLSEYEVQQFIMKRFTEEGMTCDGHGPIVGINEHPTDPHFEPLPENSYYFEPGNTVLIDLWARLDQENGVYYDVTWCGYVGQEPPEEYVRIFECARDARKAAVKLIRERFAADEPCFGWEVDDACRNVVNQAGYGDYFLHRTGHSIGTAVHGNGANIDNLETRDERQLVPGICFSIEPGIYLPGKMAVRSEINVFIRPNGEVVVYGDEQEKLILI